MILTKALIAFFLLGLLPSSGYSAKMKVMKVKDSAFFTKNANGSYKGLSLKTKVYILNSRDGLVCGSTLKRAIKSLSYFCTINLPDAKNVVRLHKQDTSKLIMIKHGRLNKKVNVTVSPGGKLVKFSTDFNETGINLSSAKLNTEFYAIYAKTAQIILAKAMQKKGIVVQSVDKK